MRSYLTLFQRILDAWSFLEVRGKHWTMWISSSISMNQKGDWVTLPNFREPSCDPVAYENVHAPYPIGELSLLPHSCFSLSMVCVGPWKLWSCRKPFGAGLLSVKQYGSRLLRRTNGSTASSRGCSVGGKSPDHREIRGLLWFAVSDTEHCKYHNKLGKSGEDLPEPSLSPSQVWPLGHSQRLEAPLLPVQGSVWQADRYWARSYRFVHAAGNLRSGRSTHLLKQSLKKRKEGSLERSDDE